ncbi:MAG: anion permease [Desulfovibrionaceae bacterium]|nr:anion permease [Desulfovibrionaceae bacterium]
MTSIPSQTSTESPVALRSLIHKALGPLLFLLIQFIPFFGPPQARVGFGILVWMVYWWITVAVDIKFTCLVPVILVAFYPYLPVEKVLQDYMHKHILLIVGATAVTAAWAKWGFAKRMALQFLLLFGNDTRKQMVGWFFLTGLVSFVMGNTPVAAIFAPIAAASLFYAGYETFESRWDSAAASNILIAVAWGASAGGMATPIGGGQAVVTLGFMEKYIGHEVFFLDWSLRMVPISLCVMVAMAAFMYFFMKPEVRLFKGSRNFYEEELKAMGPMGYEEKVVFWGFVAIVALALLRPLYIDFVKGPFFKWLHPSPLFFIFAVSLFFFPSKNNQEKTILSIPILTRHFPVAVLFIWPGAIALGRILNQTGASAVVADWLEVFLHAGHLTTVAAFSIGSNLLSQVTSDTSAAGVMIPLVIKTFEGWGGLQFGAVPFIWLSSAALSWSYAVASSTGAQGIVAGFGVNLKRMFIYGILGGVLSVLVTIVYFYVAIYVFQMDAYILPPSM